MTYLPFHTNVFIDRNDSGKNRHFIRAVVMVLISCRDVENRLNLVLDDNLSLSVVLITYLGYSAS